MLNENKGCEMGCSFYQIDWSLSNLSSEDQKRLEAEPITDVLSDNDEADLLAFKTLFVDTQKKTCLGGLITDGQPKKSCRYFTVVSDRTGEDTLATLFTQKHGRLRERPWKIATVALGLASLALGATTTVLALRESTLPDRADLVTMNADLEEQIGDLARRLASETATCDAIQDQLNACVANE
jgi:hypothetical protein